MRWPLRLSNYEKALADILNLDDGQVSKSKVNRHATNTKPDSHVQSGS